MYNSVDFCRLLISSWIFGGSCDMASYIEENNRKKKERARQQLDDFPEYVARYIMNIWRKSSGDTLINYLGDFKIFFDWLLREGFYHGKRQDIPLAILNNLSIDDVNLFLSFLDDNYKKTTANRRLSSLKSLFRYLTDKAENSDRTPLLQRNVMAKLELHRIDETMKSKAEKIAGKILLKTDEIDEQKDFLEFIYDGYLHLCPTSKTKQLHMLNRDRDCAIVSLILATGLRAFEVEGLDLDHVSTKHGTVSVIGKGGLEDILYFGEAAKADLDRYLNVRSTRYKVKDTEKALFVSLPYRTGSPGRLKKISLQSIVKKYATAFEKSSMSMHKLRHSFITRFHLVNKDIAMTKEAARHKNYQTTEIYNHIDQEMMKEAFRKANE